MKPWLNMDNFQWLLAVVLLFVLPPSIAWIPFMVFWGNVFVRGLNDRKNRVVDLEVAALEWEKQKHKELLQGGKEERDFEKWKATYKDETKADQAHIDDAIKALETKIASLEQKLSFIASSGANPTFTSFSARQPGKPDLPR